MADFEKDQDTPPGAPKDPAANENNGDGNTARSNVRDLVKNAGAAFDFLSDEGGEVVEAQPVATEAVEAAPLAADGESATEAMEEQPTAEIVAEASDVAAEVAPEIEAEAAEPAPASKKGKSPKKGGRKGGRKKGTVEAVEWNSEVASLDFVQTEAQEQKAEAAAEGSADEEGLSAFEALARRIAETVSRNEEGEEVADQNLAADMAEASDEGSSTDEAWEAAAEETESTEDEMAADEPSAADLIAAELAAAASAEEAIEASESTEVAELVEASDSDRSEAELAAADGDSGDASEMEQMGFAAMAEEKASAEESTDASAEAEVDDSAKEPTEFIEADQLVSIIESLLFSTDKPVSIATIKQIFKGSNIRTKDITRAIDLLASEYASSTRGVTLEEINGGYQLRTKSDNADYLRRLAKVRPFRLSGPALEVMAIVAYKQPITKHEIDEIRGVESGHLLRALMERGLINFNGKSDLPGKPMTYGSTRKFLEIFGLRNLKELPTLSEIDELLPEGIGEEQEKETLSDLTESMSTELTSTYSEGEEELSKINAQLQDIDTSTEFFEQEKQRERDRRDRERAQDIREKLVLGDEVDEKDRKWLDRYEAKLAQAEAAAQAGTPMVVPASEMDAAPQIGEQLEALSAEAQANTLEHEVEKEAQEIDEALMNTGDDSMDDDLTANPDYDEDMGTDY